jgi:hypothetical protein
MMAMVWSPCAAAVCVRSGRRLLAGGWIWTCHWRFRPVQMSVLEAMGLGVGIWACSITGATALVTALL